MRRSILALMLVTAACSASSSSTPPATADSDVTPFGLKLTPPPANGFQLIAPVVHGIAPSSSDEYCTWTDKIVDDEILVKATEAFQTKTGHHVVLFYTTNTQPAGTTRLCSDDDMATFRFASAAGGEGGAPTALPGDLVVHIPKGAQLVLNHHYLNAGLDTVDAQSALNVTLADPNQPSTRASAFAMLDTSMSAAPGISSFDMNCTMKKDLAMWQIQPHMHQWGQHFIFDHTSGGKTERLIDLDWDPSYQFHAPLVSRDPAAPLMFLTGDQVHVRCTWNNTTNAPLTFGLEMCVAFGETVDPADIGNIDCIAGDWGSF